MSILQATEGNLKTEETPTPGDRVSLAVVGNQMGRCHSVQAGGVMLMPDKGEGADTPEQG